jgi:ribosomal protein S14
LEKTANNGQPVIIKKATGEAEPFNVDKLKKSLRNAGAEDELTEEVASDINSWITDGITTQKIYSRAFSLLRKKQKDAASRYKLKNAIMELGPTGYPFEHFIGKILTLQGFSTQVGQVIHGRCVTHEVDVIATRGNEQYFIECKYGTSPGKIYGVQVPLYIRSRVDDIINNRKNDDLFKGFTFHGGVVTNTRFSSDAIAYGTCSGLYVLSWDYPSGSGLKDLIDREKIFPITVLHNLTKNQKQSLMDRGIIICRQIMENPGVLSHFNLSKNKFRSLVNELEKIL